MTAPSILLVDDGELDEIQAMLERLRVDWVRCAEPGDLELERPRDLIISSGPRSLQMPHLSGGGEPVWICLYGQDFLPLREQLAGLGVHYLVSQELAPRAFELFVRQLLYQGSDRRRVRRIPMQCEFQLDVGVERRKALLLELSPESCVFACNARVPDERRVVVRLPAQTLTGNEELDLPGTIVRSSGTARDDGECSVVHVFRFASLDADSMAALQRTLSGESVESEVTPLASEPTRARGVDSTPNDPDAELEIELISEVPRTIAPTVRGERRSAIRRPYTRCVDAIRWQGDSPPQVVFGCDLSATGMRVAVSPPPVPGSQVALALYGGGRAEPVLVEAEVVRVDGGEAGLRFRSLEPTARRQLRTLIEGAPRIERLSGSRSALCVAEIVEG